MESTSKPAAIGTELAEEVQRLRKRVNQLEDENDALALAATREATLLKDVKRWVLLVIMLRIYIVSCLLDNETVAHAELQFVSLECLVRPQPHNPSYTQIEAGETKRSMLHARGNMDEV